MPVTSATRLPDDPALPALRAIRTMGAARTVACLGVDGRPIDLELRSHTPGSRATFDMRVGMRRFALKAFAHDPATEARLCGALSAALDRVAEVRVPSLVAWDRDLRVLVLEWLDGPTAAQLIRNGSGARAGELAARWLWRAPSLPVTLGVTVGASDVMKRAQAWAARLAAVDPDLGTAATAVLLTLARTLPPPTGCHLVHGTLYTRHVLDLGDAAGLIDWDRFGQGPAELDAGTFLATTWRSGLRHREGARAEAAFLAATAGLLDEHALAWYRATVLVRLANKVNRRAGAGRTRARALLREAARVAASLQPRHQTGQPTNAGLESDAMEPSQPPVVLPAGEP